MAKKKTMGYGALPKPTKEPLTVKKSFLMSKAVADRAMDAAYWTRKTLRSIVEDAINAEVDRLEREQGATFKRRSGPIKTGRPFLVRADDSRKANDVPSKSSPTA